MRTVRLLFPLLAMALAGFAQDVRYNYAAGEDFSKYRTYKWVVFKNADQLDQLADQQLKTAIDIELAKKGLVKTEDEKADLLIGYQVSLGQEKQFTSFNSGWDYGPGWGRGWYGPTGGISTTTSSTIVTGQVDLDMYDAAAQKLVWRGTASKTLDMKAKPQKRQKNLQKGAAKLLKNYPPQPKNG